MDFILDEPQVRVLGSLLEKELTTPEYYPLTLNALINACNQKTSREPVVNYDEKTVARALDSLIHKRLAYQDLGSGRVPKYGHNLAGTFNLLRKELAALTIMLLRGPQTSGEIRGRTGRMHEFGSTEDVEESIGNLTELGLAAMLPRRPGHTENRFGHLLSGEIKAEAETAARLEPPAVEVRAENERITALESEIKSLREDVSALKDELSAFKKQFE